MSSSPPSTPFAPFPSTSPPASDTEDVEYENAYLDEHGNILEDYLDTLVVLPVELRRSLNLLRELDAKCTRDLSSLASLQEAHLEMRKRQADDSALVGKIEAARKRVEILLEEKGSVTQQVVDLTKRNLRRLNRDLRNLENVLRTTGDLEEDTSELLAPGMLVAAYDETKTEGDSQWILAKVVEVGNKRVTVSDADADGTQFAVSLHRVVALLEDEDVASARTRLGQRSKEVMAIYPETTMFYKAQISSNPFRAGIEHGPLANKICVSVVFDGDEDPATGVCPKRVVATVNVFVPRKD